MKLETMRSAEMAAVHYRGHVPADPALLQRFDTGPDRGVLDTGPPP